MINNERLWQDPIHLSFIESLDKSQVSALWELLVVATFADDEMSVDERRDLAGAFRDIPGFGAIDLSDNADDLERLFQAYEDDVEELLQSISGALGDESARRGAFRTAVQLIKSDGLRKAEADFVRRLGALLGLEPEVIEFSLTGL